jgi:hypothetical protein
VSYFFFASTITVEPAWHAASSSVNGTDIGDRRALQNGARRCLARGSARELIAAY